MLHTTWSHTDDHHKFRVVLPLAVPVRAADWRPFWDWAAARTGPRSAEPPPELPKRAGSFFREPDADKVYIEPEGGAVDLESGAWNADEAFDDLF